VLPTLSFQVLENAVQHLNLLGLGVNEALPFLLHQQVQFVMQLHQLHLALQVDFVVVGHVGPVLRCLAVLRHHDHRRLEGSEHRQKQIEENVGIGVELVAHARQDVGIEDDPSDEGGQKYEDECPRAAEFGDPISEALTEGQLFVDGLADVAGGPAAFDDIMNDRCSRWDSFSNGVPKNVWASPALFGI
jgi:hypothetical protein